jgi:hypothetical protein
VVAVAVVVAVVVVVAVAVVVVVVVVVAVAVAHCAAVRSTAGKLIAKQTRRAVYRRCAASAWH